MVGYNLQQAVGDQHPFTGENAVKVADVGVEGTHFAQPGIYLAIIEPAFSFQDTGEGIAVRNCDGFGHEDLL
jgi:hypothetical protein